MAGPAMAGAGAPGKPGCGIRRAGTSRVTAVGAVAVLRALSGLRKRADFRAGVVAVSQYNVRYGLQLLPAFAVFVPLGIAFVVQSAMKIRRVEVSWDKWAPVAAMVSVFVLVISSYGAIWRAQPICYREADINMHGRVALDRQLAGWLKSLPPDSTLLMYLGEHSGALEQAGFPLRQTINEGNHRMWKRPVDPEGLWDRALADPATYADYAIGFDGDPVWAAAEDRHLKALVVIHTTGQPRAAVFQGRTQARGNN